MHHVTGETQLTELQQRLRIGGRWYLPGDAVLLDKADVEFYELRGVSKPAKPGAEPKNVEKIRAQDLGIMVKGAGETDAAAPATTVLAAATTETTPTASTTTTGAQHGRSSRKAR